MITSRLKCISRGLTLIELLVVIAILGVLFGALVGFAVHARKVSQDVLCLSNLRQISTALVMYNQEYRMVPPADPPLSETLACMLNEPKVFICPASRVFTQDSYSRYYVPRLPTEGGGYMLGCANHGDEGITPSAFGSGRVEHGKIEQVLWNDKPVKMGGQVSGGTLKFSDGTVVKITDNLNVVVITSFFDDGGKIYSAIRIPRGAVGSIEVTAAHGTHFEVATPACTAGVRGTQFTVATSESPTSYATVVKVLEGVVAVDWFYPEVKQQAMKAGEQQQFEEPKKPSLATSVLGVSSKVLTYKVSNTGKDSFLITGLSLTWPTSTNKRLDQVQCDSLVVYKTQTKLSPLSVVSFLGVDSYRTVAPGQSRTISFTFEKNASIALNNYSLDITASIVK